MLWKLNLCKQKDGQRERRILASWFCERLRTINTYRWLKYCQTLTFTLSWRFLSEIYQCRTKQNDLLSDCKFSNSLWFLVAYKQFSKHKDVYIAIMCRHLFVLNKQECYMSFYSESDGWYVDDLRLAGFWKRKRNCIVLGVNILHIYTNTRTLCQNVIKNWYLGLKLGLGNKNCTGGIP